MYLLKRRLRHLNAISILRVSLTNTGGGDQDMVHTVSSLFLAIEDLKGRCLYVSEAQNGSHGSVQFEEMPSLPYTMTKIRLKVLGQVPQGLLEISSDSPVWTVLVSYTLDLSRLCPIASNDGNVCPKNDNVNVPVFHFPDGLFGAPGVFENAPKNSIELIPHRKSFTFNGALKLNKILEYWTQIHVELEDLSREIDTIVDENPKPLRKQVLLHASEELELAIELRREKIKSLKRTNNSDSCYHCNPSTEQRINEDYGATLSEYTNALHRMQHLEERKIGQLLTAMKKTGLCDRNGFVVPNTKDQSAYEIQLQRVSTSTAMDNTERISKNSLLGYYLLFVYILAERVFRLPLPHQLSFYGSTSVIDNTLPLYLADSPTQKHVSDFKTALERFNLNIMQVNQFLERHR
ncbi:LAME_0H18360g1_1 [Lachancea meyersii CBS 8951]|uniref:LAME_0H18360g1_1 n=1 Tax=Lachancea meyersii CBS 8951 TaxID=1266667 RepID=A0A1G4KIQ6_9SACH|nr:LAME_0H18360g1_1 [Lachancea meyersii CBS 8951]